MPFDFINLCRAINHEWAFITVIALCCIALIVTICGVASANILRSRDYMKRICSEDNKTHNIQT